MMEPLSGASSVIAVAGAGLTTISAVNTIVGRYAEAQDEHDHAVGMAKLMRHADKRHRRGNKHYVPDNKRHGFELGLERLGEMQTLLPISKRKLSSIQKVKYAVKAPSRCKNEKILQRINTVAISTLISGIQIIDETLMRIETTMVDEKKMSSIHDQPKAVRGEPSTEKESGDWSEKCILVPTKSSTEPRQGAGLTSDWIQVKGDLKTCQWASSLGVVVDGIVTQTASEADHKLYSVKIASAIAPHVLIEWRIRRSTALSLRSLFPRIIWQNTKPEESNFFQSIKRGDADMVVQLLDEGQAGPNDKTPENMTPLRFAIRAGKPKVVEALLQRGADPNLTFGRHGDTSPLNNAFQEGSLEIANMLLKYNADLDYINMRGWASISYLWDPEPRPEGDSSPEVMLDWAHNHDFVNWDIGDVCGWTPMHRAAAFGTKSEVEKLLRLKASPMAVTTSDHWAPVHVAAKYGNMETFECLSKISYPTKAPQDAFPALTDLKGWTLLHLAAEGGNKEMIFMLLRAGASPSVKTQKSLQPDAGLSDRTLTPREVAQFFGKVNVFDQALKDAGMQVLA